MLIVTGAALTHQLQRGIANSAPDFRSLRVGETRKTVFFEFLRPLVEQENARITDERRMLLTIAGRLPELGWLDRYRLRRLRDKYLPEGADLDGESLIAALLLRVDVIPESLALAQAAKESGWGTARFAEHGNNYFGQRCWDAGCGLVPRAREAGRRHEVATYASPQASVAGYLLNLNTHEDYAALRSRRSELRAEDESIHGVALAESMAGYSERRRAYVDEIRLLIRLNNLEEGM